MSTIGATTPGKGQVTIEPLLSETLNVNENRQPPQAEIFDIRRADNRSANGNTGDSEDLDIANDLQRHTIDHTHADCRFNAAETITLDGE